MTLIAGVACNADDDHRPGASAQPSQHGSSSQAATGGAAATTSRAESVSARPPHDRCNAATLADELNRYCTLGEQSAPPDVAVLPWAIPPGKRPNDGLEIGLGRGGQLRVNGSPIALERIGDTLRRRASLELRPTTPTWTLAVHPNAMAADVARLLRTLAREGAPSGHLAFRVREELSLARPRDPKLLAALDANLARSSVTEKAVMLAKVIQTSPVSRCSPLVKTFSAVAGVARENKCKLLAVGIAEGLPKCQCKDADEILTLMYAVMVNTAPTQQQGAWIRVTWSETAPAIVVGDGSPWSGFVSQLDPARLGDLRMTDE